MIKRISMGWFPRDYCPTIYDTDSVRIATENGDVNLELWDTVGHDDFDRIRILAYQRVEAVVMCYCVDNWDSFEHITTKWAPEAKLNAPNASLILVACKTDLRERVAREARHISTLEGRRKAATLKVAGFHECSALNGQNANEVLNSIATEVMRERQGERQSGKCVVS